MSRVKAGWGRTWDLWRRLPRAAKACALVAFLNAFVWALLTPPFHVPDESVHLAYIQYLAETGDLPSDVPGQELSTQEAQLVEALRVYGVAGNPDDKPIWSTVEQRKLDDLRDRNFPRGDNGGKTVAAGNPPLYYAVNAVVYRLTPTSDLITRLYVLRTLSALLAAFTVMFIFLFLRELLPGTPWAWTVGALVVAFQPMFSFEAGGINNDNGLYLCVAALMFATARALRRGLTIRRGVAIGAALGLGALCKFTMAAFAPMVGLALIYMVWKAKPEQRRRVLAACAVTVAVGSVLVFAYVGLNSAVFDRPLIAHGTVSGQPAPPLTHPASRREQFTYTWQLFLPRLPFMEDTFPGSTPLWDTWFTGVNGRFGLLDYHFPASFYRWIWWLVFFPAVVLAGRALWLRRDAIRRWGPQFVIYGSSIVGLMYVIGGPSYSDWLTGAAFPFHQPRYVLALLPLYAAIAALAVRGAGRRAGPAVGTALVMFALAHTLFSQLLTVARFYG